MRKATGTIERKKGRPVYIRIQLATGERRRIPVDRAWSPAMLEEKRRYWADLAATGKLVVDPDMRACSKGSAPAKMRGEETVTGYVDRWLKEREGRNLSS